MDRALLPLVLVLVAGCRTVAGDAAASVKDAAASHLNHDTAAASHGMVLFGSSTLIASHIPTYGEPHDWQAFFEVTLSHPTQDALKAYQTVRGTSDQPLVTLRPKPFVLPKLLRGEITEFTATIHKGNFEQGGPAVLKDVKVTVKKVMMREHLSNDDPALAALSYLPVGKFLAHRISAPNNFDHIVEVSWLGATLPGGADFDPQRRLSFAPVGDAAASRLKKGDAFDVTANGNVWTATKVAADAPPPGEGVARLRIMSDFYCTPGPDFFGDCG